MGLGCPPVRSRAIHRTGPGCSEAGLPSLPSSPSTSRRRPTSDFGPACSDAVPGSGWTRPVPTGCFLGKGRLYFPLLSPPPGPRREQRFGVALRCRSRPPGFTAYGVEPSPPLGAGQVRIAVGPVVVSASRVGSSARRRCPGTGRERSTEPARSAREPGCCRCPRRRPLRDAGPPSGFRPASSGETPVCEAPGPY